MPRAGYLEELSQKLKALAQVRSELDVTQLQIINLDDVRLAFGLKWLDVRTRVIDTATHFLQNRLTPDDLLIPCGNGFVIVFGSIAGASAEIAGLQLARALNHFFIGEQGLDAFKVGCKHETLELSSITNLVRTLGEIEPAKPVRGTLSATEETEVAFKFMPQWDVRHEAISTFITVPYDTQGNPIEHDERDMLGMSSRRAGLTRDKAMIEASVQALSQLLAFGDQAIIDVKLHASSLSDISHRHEILEVLGTIDQRIRRYLMVTIGDVVHGFPRYHLDELLHLIGQKIERVCVELSYDDPDIESVAGCAAWAIGYGVPRMLHPMLADTADSVQARLQRDARRLHRHGKRMMVGVPGPAMVHWCKAAGVDFVSCRALWPVIDAPRGVERYELPKPAAA